MSKCPADMSGIHAPDEHGKCWNCDAMAFVDTELVGRLAGVSRADMIRVGAIDPGCYICQPTNPNADEEGCERCDEDYWSHVLAPTEEDYRAAGIVLNPKAL